MDYRSMVRQIATDTGLDPNLAEAVLVQESGGNPNAVSKAGARGLMQLMPGTAKDLGVDPSDPSQNLLGGVRYLKQQIDKYGVEGGLAAYNAGPGRVDKVMSFAELPSETQKYVPSVMNRAAQIAMNSNGATVSDAGPSLGIGDFMGAFDKAKAAGDDAAMKEIGGQLQKQFADALSKAQAAGDTGAVNEIKGMAAKYSLAPAAPVAAPKPAEAPKVAAALAKTEATAQLAKTAKQVVAEAMTNPSKDYKPDWSTLGKIAQGVGDTLTAGWLDEGAGKVAKLLGYNGDKVTDALRQNAKEGGAPYTAGQVAGALIPVGGVIGGVATGSRLARAGMAALTGGAQGALYGAGSADDGNRIEGAIKGGAIGAATGGILGGVLPQTTTQKVSKAVDKAGGVENAALQAEIAQRVKKEFDNPARMVNGKLPDMTPKELNGKVVDSFLREGKAVIDQLPKDSPGKKQLTAAITRGLKNTTDELEALQNVPGGKEVADIINKATKADKMTAQALQSPTFMAHALRMGIDTLPPAIGTAIGGPIGGAVGLGLTKFVADPIAKRLTGKMTRTEVGQKIVNNAAELAPEILKKTGPSSATQSLEQLQQLAQKAQAGRQAQIAQQQAAQAAALAQQAATKNQVLQQTRMPAGGGFQELMTGGRSGLNMTSGDAIDALRTVSKAAKGTPVGDAAKAMLQSKPVTDEQAFYGVQNMIRRLSEEGKIAGSQMTPGALSSGIRNPVSYEANVKNATEALKLARDNAPTKELSQFASTVGSIKNRADKMKKVEERLANAVDPAEVEYLTKLVKPLANFGKK